MKVKKIITELDNLCEFVLMSNSHNDFGIRFNFLLSMVVTNFEEEMYKSKKLPFLSYIYIDLLNNKLNAIIDKINDADIPFNEGILAQDIFLLILQEDFPQYYHNYQYQMYFINN